MAGKVYLVGGGPGDLELLTRKAYRLIQEADCLIYDRLIDPKILAETKDSCEQIYVGKQNRFHSMKQVEINQLLATKAKEHPCVVRLKGGDVYVFGRGGEEGLYLREQNVEFEVVPGISSSIAGLAYAGIPITHRGIATGFHVVTAHNQLDELADIDFKAMARSKETNVFLMGLSKLSEIVSKLLEAEMSPDTKIALISNATLPSQQVIVSDLSGILSAFEKNPLPSPALIVVGGVVKLREQLNFFEEKKLFGKKILLPMAGSSSSALGKTLTMAGAEVHEVLTSYLKENKQALDEVCLEKYTHIILTSKNAVRFFFNSLKKNRIDIRSLNSAEFAVVGTATRDYLKEYGIYASIMPETFHQEALLEQLEQVITENSRILFPKVMDENKSIIPNLQKTCPIDVIELYENIPVEGDNILEKLSYQPFDAVIFNCSSSVHNTMKQIKSSDKFLDAVIFSIGEKTSAALSGYGISNVIQAEKATFEAVLDIVGQVLGKR